MYEQVVPNSVLTRVNGISDSDFRNKSPESRIRNKPESKGFGSNPSQGFAESTRTWITPVKSAQAEQIFFFRSRSSQGNPPIYLFKLVIGTTGDQG